MKRLLSPLQAAVLAKLAGSAALVAFDFDGTLAPIVARRGSARMRARTRTLLAKVCRLYPCAVITGRSRVDVTRRLSGAAVKWVVGNHGLEPGSQLARFEKDIVQARTSLRGALAGLQGVDFEDKRYTLAIHYRRATDKRKARAAILRAVAGLAVPTRTIAGKLVINLVPQGAPNKGTALLALRRAAKAVTALYVGDDVTDEDVFALDRSADVLTVRVGRSKSSAATYYLREQSELDQLLSRLIELRERRI